HAGTNVQTNDNGERVMLVKFEDLSVETKAGRATLDRRIAAAAAQVCSNNSGSRLLAMNSDERACIAKASSQARVTVLAKIEERGTATRIAAAQ
ncbi:MAG: UrcA family protein, partial [Erythrobacter sp.]